MILTPLSFLCLFASRTGPPGYYFEGLAYITLFPIDKFICPQIIPNLDIRFELYTSNNNPTQPEILLLDDKKSVLNSSLDFNKVTVIYFHGFMESGKYGSAVFVRDAYMQRNDHNFLVVNAQRILAGPWYFTAARNTKAVGEYSARMVDFLVEMGMDLNKVHIIGHSLGGHSAGITGHLIKSGKVARITGLDPALPLFLNAPLESRLDSSDAHFVDVIHTASYSFGISEPIGHADFYPNGGSSIQPGCTAREIQQKNPNSLLEQVFCSHWRSFLFYTESILNPKSFVSTSCTSWKNYKTGKCFDDCKCIYMGFGLSHNARGVFYLTTNKDEPYSKF